MSSCRNCGREVSYRAETCPGCGEPEPGHQSDFDMASSDTTSSLSFNCGLIGFILAPSIAGLPYWPHSLHDAGMGLLIPFFNWVTLIFICIGNWSFGPLLASLVLWAVITFGLYALLDKPES